VIVCVRTVRVPPDARERFSHDAFDAWIQTPDRDRLTASEVQASVEYGPITRRAIVGGYVRVDGLAAVAEQIGEVRS
jgi:hypothetical protein